MELKEVIKLAKDKINYERNQHTDRYGNIPSDIDWFMLRHSNAIGMLIEEAERNLNEIM